MSRLRTIFALIVFSVAAAYAQRQMTVAQLVDFIKSSVQQHNDDKKVADFVKTIKLTNRLDDATVEQLQNAGAGARTIAALRALTDSTANLAPAAPAPAAAKPAPIVVAPPSAADQKRMLDELAEHAVNYTKTHHNFLCTQ